VLTRPLLTDGEVLLRPWRAADAAQMFAGFSDPLVQRHSWPSLAPYTEADARAYLAEQATAEDERAFAIVAPPDPETVLGGTSLYDIRCEQGSAAVGYWLAPQARGAGLATRAVRLLAAWAFGELGVERLELTCGPDNAASQRVAERCGFVREGVLRSHLPFKGARRDTVMYSLLRTEWLR